MLEYMGYRRTDRLENMTLSIQYMLCQENAELKSMAICSLKPLKPTGRRWS